MLKSIPLVGGFGLLLIAFETLQSILFFAYVTALLKNKDFSELVPLAPSLIHENPLLSLALSTTLLFLSSFVFYTKVQTWAAVEHANTIKNQFIQSNIREASAILGKYFNAQPYEIMQRLGLGYVGSISLLITRIAFVLGSLVYIYVVNPKVLLYLLAAGFICVLAVFGITHAQRQLGKAISEWSENSAKYSSLATANLIVRDLDISSYLPLINKILIYPNALSQSLSSSTKPIIEILLLITLVYLNTAEVINILSDPATLAVIYRIYTNAITISSLINLASYSRPALLNIQSGITQAFTLNTAFDKRLLQLLVSEAVSKQGFEIRGPSGAGKTLYLESIAHELRSKGKKVFLWMPSMNCNSVTIKDFEKIIASSVSSSIIETFRNFNSCVDLDPNCLIESLSLGQKALLGISSAINTDCDIILLDEPLANLDSGTKELAVRLIAELAITKIVIITNHSDEINGFEKITFK